VSPRCHTVHSTYTLGTARQTLTTRLHRPNLRRVLVISSSTPNSSNLLTTFNASLRRAFLFCKLLSPLFVSLLTSFASYPTACSTLLVMSLLSLGGELWWIGVVWNSWTCLEDAEVERRRMKEDDRVEVSSESRGDLGGSVRGVVRETVRDMMEFAQMPVFLSESCRSEFCPETVICRLFLMSGFLLPFVYGDTQVPLPCESYERRNEELLR
jgi:hypothetical protein